MTNENQQWLLFIAIWYITGFLSLLTYYAIKYGQIKVKDIKECLGVGVAGFLIPAIGVCILIFKFVGDILEKLDDDKVLWRSKRKKTEHILYGKDKNNDDYGI